MRSCSLMIAFLSGKNIGVDFTRATVSVLLFKYMNYRYTETCSLFRIFGQWVAEFQTVMLPRMVTVMSLVLIQHITLHIKTAKQLYIRLQIILNKL